MAGTRKFPSYLLLVAGLVFLTDIFVLVSVSENFLCTTHGMLMVLFLPGYALIAALFPAKSYLDGIERTVLSLGMSIAAVPLINLDLNYTSRGIRLLPIFIGLSIFTFIMCWLAYIRREKLPETEVFNFHFRETAQ